MRRQLDGGEGAERLGAVRDGKMDFALEADTDVAVAQARHGVVLRDNQWKSIRIRSFHIEQVTHEAVDCQDSVVAFADGAEDFELERIGERLFDGFRGVPTVEINGRC